MSGPATAEDLGRVLCEALGIDSLKGIYSLTLVAEAGSVPTVRIVRYIDREQVEELRRLMLRFDLGPDEINPAAPAPEPYCYVYEFDTYNGAVHRSLSPAPYNGATPDRAVPLYAHPVAPAPDTADSIMALALMMYACPAGTLRDEAEVDLRAAVERVIAENRTLRNAAVNEQEARERAELQLTAANELRRESIIQGLAMQGKLMVAEQEAAALRELLRRAERRLCWCCCATCAAMRADINAALEGT